MEAKGKKPGAATATGVSASCQYSTSRCNDSVMHRSFGQGGKSMLVRDVTTCGSPLGVAEWWGREKERSLERRRP